MPLFMSSPSPTETNTLTTANTDDDDDEEEEWEYVEYEELSEADMIGSEWLVGTVMDRNPNKIEETWCRCVVDDDGKNVCIWGDGSKGKWSLDRASQYVSWSKEYLWGKEIWAGTAEDYYYLQGTVRGWTYLTPASVDGQWQAKRLGVDPDEAGTPPWFEEEQEDESETEKGPTEEEASTEEEAASESA